MANARSPLGPYDIGGATPLTGERFYVGKLIRDPDGRWVLLAFLNEDENGSFVGELTDPMPVGWDGDRLALPRHPGPLVDVPAR